MECVVGKWCYYDCAITLKAYSQKQSKELFSYVESNKHTLFFVGYVEYEFYRYLRDWSYESVKPYCVFYGFRRRRRFARELVSQERFAPSVLRPLDEARYMRDFALVKDAIACGRSYETNLTQELVFSTKLDSSALFHLLCARQDTPYKAFIPEENGAIISLSPELFFSLKGRRITTKPMKGTMPKGKGNKRKLAKDGKNKSENLMIVDLLRNDLARISKPKSLRVKLFSIESYPTLYQMTSTIQATLKRRVRFYDIFAALFPCGSITGAPKQETMKLIESLEKRDRGIYCGSIGVVHKERASFSVAIRTLHKSGESCCYGVGSGIVWESSAQEEWQELGLKTQIVRARECCLFETMLLQGKSIVLLKYHLQRLLDSARKLGFESGRIGAFARKFNGLESTCSNDFLSIDRELFGDSSAQKSSPKHILRLVLHKDGTLESKATPLQDHTSTRLLLSPTTLQSASDSLYHKSSLHAVYDAQSHLWRENHCYDVAFFNERGELCEGSRSNIVVRQGARFYTPALSSGLLNGVYRQFLLQKGAIQERVLYAKDLENASAIYCINSVRGAKKVEL
ncbi:bifunctional anthranilate synthase component I family protein/class IV aminotransferase [Helicobacter canis]|uniref:bifunctional anthranilate synthase component I family protein/class IV aminotransferase n=1 Tax=Helicobacter canis TaxID=29419 RepID=UPI0029428B9D|nr:bifunctional anthranilate synthase component I family protein/class IV aminotransferase [Helicobacter canis]